jgi:3-hydroxybutyryl-CoA dehydrogenase
MTGFTIGIVGSGAMGRGIAQLFLQSGYRVVLCDLAAAALASARAHLQATFTNLVAKGKLSQAEVDSAMAQFSAVTEIEALKNCSLIIEAIVEQLAAKQNIFKQLESLVADSCILATNTSSLSVTAIAAACQKPERVAGLHFFNPVPLMRVVEVVRAVRTASTVIDQLNALVKTTGHLAVTCSDTPGFIVNHAGRGYGTEALRIMGEGVIPPASPDSNSFAVVDDVLREQVRLNNLGFRLGPFELLDLTALDVSHPVMESIYRQYFEEPRFRPSVITSQRLAAGLVGKKVGAGFYHYADSEPRPQTHTSAAAGAKLPNIVWVGPGLKRSSVVQLLESLKVKIEHTANPSADALILLLPEGQDCTDCALQLGVSPHRSVALDTWFDLGSGPTARRVLMRNPASQADCVDTAVKVLSLDQAKVTVINDSPGFIAPRIIGMIVSIACEMAQAGVASPSDIDNAVKLGLGYPVGPLSMGDVIGPARVLGLMQQMHNMTGDPRYRPSLWLRRRAMLGMSLLQA